MGPVRARGAADRTWSEVVPRAELQPQRPGQHEAAARGTHFLLRARLGRPPRSPRNSRPRSTHPRRTPRLTCACHAPSGRRDERGEPCRSPPLLPCSRSGPGLRRGGGCGSRSPGGEVYSLGGRHCPSRIASGSLKLLERGCF